MFRRTLLGLLGLLLVGGTAMSMSFLESTHPYAINLDETKSCTIPGSPVKVWITFWPQTKTESGYDFIYIYDGVGNPIGNPAGYSGTTLADVTLEVPGDTVRVRLVSDYDVGYYGYRATVNDSSPYMAQVGDSDTRPLSQPSSRGPWVYGSAVYTIADNGSSIASVWKSTDRGQTWAEVDNAHAPSDAGGFAYVASATRRGNLLYLLHYLAAHPHDATITVFDLTTDLWVSPAVATGGPSPHVGFNRTSLVSRSNGSFVLVAEVGNNVQYSTWSSLAGWSALANVTTLYPNETRLRGGAFLGGADRVHIPLICGPTEMYYDLVISTLTLAGALSDTDTGITVGYELGQSGYVYCAKTYVVGGVTWFALPMNRTVGGAYQQPTHLLRGISADTISEYWEEHIGVTADPVHPTNYNHAVVVGSDGHLYAFYGRTVEYDYNDYVTFFLARYTGTGAEKYNNSAGWSDDTAVYAWKPGDYSSDPEIGGVDGQIGVLYTLGFTQYWFGRFGLWNMAALVGCRYHGF